MTNMVEMLSKVNITQSELNNFYELERGLGDYRCDEDWVPTLRVVEEQIIGRYQETVRKKIHILEQAETDNKRANTNEYDCELKGMLFFMLWILDTCAELDEAARARLDSFVHEKLIITDDITDEGEVV